VTESRDFDVPKSEQEWQDLYSKHDLLEKVAIGFLQNNGFSVEQNGIDKRDTKVWEAGEDEPDAYIQSTRAELYVDWKAKTSESYIGMVNKRSYKSYEVYDGRVFICFGLVDLDPEKISQMLFADVDKATIVGEMVEWDENDVVELGGKAYLSSLQFAKHFGEGAGAWYRPKNSVLNDPRPKPSPIEKVTAWVAGETE